MDKESSDERYYIIKIGKNIRCFQDRILVFRKKDAAKDELEDVLAMEDIGIEEINYLPSNSIVR